MSRFSLQRYFVPFLCVIAVLLAVQAVFPPQVQPYDPTQLAQDECIGTPIRVSMAYSGSTLDPWSCQSQCDDKQQHYLLYANGAATQCEKLPGCNDYGEDRGITCRVPDAEMKTPVSE